VVWCGVVWCGVVWCGVVWCGVVWCGVVVGCGVQDREGLHEDWSGGVTLRGTSPLEVATAHGRALHDERVWDVGAPTTSDQTS